MRLMARPNEPSEIKISPPSPPTLERAVYIPTACADAVAVPPPRAVMPRVIGISEAKNPLIFDIPSVMLSISGLRYEKITTEEITPTTHCTTPESLSWQREATEHSDAAISPVS